VDDRIAVTDPFRFLPPDFHEQLSLLCQLIETYRHLAARTEGKDDDVERQLVQDDARLVELSKFIRDIAELLKFVRILGRQKSQLLTNCLATLNYDVLRRLEQDPFGDPSASMSIDDALHQFALALFEAAKDDPNLTFLASDIGKECPMFSRVSDHQIGAALNQLETCVSSRDVQEAVKASQILLNYCDHPIDLHRICKALNSLSLASLAVKIVTERGKAIDANQRALFWWKSGCDETDIGGKKIFDLLTQCYECLFSFIHEDDNLKTIIAVKDEFLHIIVFDQLMGFNKIDRLLSLSSPFLETFLECGARHLLWRLYAKQGRYLLASKELIVLAADSNELSNDERIEFLENARSYAKKANSREMVLKSEDHLKTARIQGLMDLPNQKLLSLNDLLKEAKLKELWDIGLLILNSDASYSRDPQKVDEVKDIWQEVLGSYRDCNEAELIGKIADVFRLLGKEGWVLSGDILVPIFEDLRFGMELRAVWAADVLTDLGVNANRLFLSYCDVILRGLPNNVGIGRRNQLVYAALWLLQKSGAGDWGCLNGLVKEILGDESSPFHREIDRIVKLLV
jgi:hypothetical protein